MATNTIVNNNHIIYHTADWHLGYKSKRVPVKNNNGVLVREQDIRDNIMSIINASITNNINALIIAGDLFDSAIVPLEIIGWTINALKLLENAKIHTYIIAGNHDTPFSSTTYPAFILLQQSFLTSNYIHLYYNDTECVDIPNTNISLILVPHSSLYNNNYSIKDLTQYINTQHNNHKKVYLITHGDTEKTLGSYASEEIHSLVIPSTLINLPVDMVLLGHYHQYEILQETPLTIYSGSPENTVISGPASEKYKVYGKINTNNNTWEPIKLNIRPLIELSIDFTNIDEALITYDVIYDKIIEQVPKVTKNSIVTLKIINIPRNIMKNITRELLTQPIEEKQPLHIAPIKIIYREDIEYNILLNNNTTNQNNTNQDPLIPDNEITNIQPFMEETKQILLQMKNNKKITSKQEKQIYNIIGELIDDYQL